MATTSIFADFSIRDPEKAARFVDAVYQSMELEKNKSKRKKPKKDFTELKNTNEIRSFIRNAK